MNDIVQKNAEILEELVEREAITSHPKLSTKEFLAINAILLHLQAKGEYKLQDRFKETI